MWPTKRKTLEDKQKLREYCRLRLNNLETYFEKQYNDFMTNIICIVKMAIDIEKSSLHADHLQNVTSNLLREFLLDNSCIEFSPSLQSAEYKFKEIFLKGICTCHKFTKVKLDDVPRSWVPFNFEPLCEPISDTIALIDEFLSEAFLPLFGVQFYLSNFAHLIVMDEKAFLDDETTILVRENKFRPLKEEILRLREDERCLNKLGKWIYVGLIKIDVEEIRKTLLDKIDFVLRESLDSVMVSKFTKLLSENRERFESITHNLNQIVNSVESFISMKTFVYSQELTDSIDTIERETNLCKDLNNFLEQQFRSTESFMFEYMASLDWVRNLRRMQVDIKKKLGDTSSNFIQELKIESDSILNELVVVQRETKKFELNADFIKSNIYYNQVVELNRQLSDLQERADKVNQKQVILESKETNFEQIAAEIKSFEKYFSWWEFIAAMWSPSVETWWRGNFHDIKPYEMQSTILSGSDLLKKLADEFSGMMDSPLLEIIRQKQKEVEHHQTIYNHISILKDPAFKERHWEAFFLEIKEQDKGSVGMQQDKIDIKKITLQELMDMHLLSHTNFLKQLLIKAKSEAVIEQSIKSIKDSINKIGIKPRIFENDIAGLQIITNVTFLISLLYEYLSKIENMMSNAEFPAEFKIELKSLEQLVRFTIDALQHMNKIQNQLIQYSPVFRYKALTSYVDYDAIIRFKNVKQDFQDITKDVFAKEMAFFRTLLTNTDEPNSPEDLIMRLVELEASCDSIYETLKGVFKQVRVACPRYYFFTDEQMVMLCSLLKFPKSLFGLISNLFKDISSIDLQVYNDGSEVDRVVMNGLIIKSGESINLGETAEIDLSNNAELPLISIIKTIETSIDDYFVRSRVDHLHKIAALNFNFAEILKYAKSHKIIFQNLRLFVQIIFDYELLSLFKAGSDSQSKIDIYECLINLKKILGNSVTDFLDYPYKFVGEQYSNKLQILYFDSFIMQIRHLETIVDHLIKKEAVAFSSFDFQILPKYCIEFPKDLLSLSLDSKMLSVEDICAQMFQHTNSLQAGNYKKEVTSAATSLIFEKLFCAKRANVSLNSMGYSIQHKNELGSNTYPMVFTLMFERGLFCMVSAIVNCKFVLLNGPSDIGKNNQIRCLSQLVGIPLFESDCSLNQNIHQVPSYFAGLLSGGFWVSFKGIESCSNHLLSVISTQVETMKAALRSSELTLQEGLTVKPVPGHCVFVTCRQPLSFNHHSAGNLPIGLIEHFRILTLSQPPLIQILQSLVSPCLDFEESKVWAKKLSLFIKIYKKIDFEVDQSPETQASLNNRFSGGYVVFQLKTVCKLVRRSMERLYLHIGSLYEKHRDPETNQYPLAIDKLQVINRKMRTAVFTRLFIETVCEYFHQTETVAFKIKGIHDLISDIFRDEIEASFTHDINSLMPAPDIKFKDRVVESIKEYKESYQSSKLPQASKLFTRIEGFVKTVYQSRHQSVDHFMVYGNPDTQKSTLIELLAYLYSELHKFNFRKYWLNLESLNREHIFGTEGFDGLLKEIFYQCHNMDLEDKTTQPKKINLLFQSNSELFFQLADNRDLKKAKSKELKKNLSWIIFDANTGKNNPRISQTIGAISSLFNILHSPNEINEYIGFSSNLKVFYEMNTVALLDPKLLTQMKLFYLDQPLISLHERFSIWLDSIKEKDFFFRATSEFVETLIEELVFTFISKLEEKNSEDQSHSLLLVNKSQLSMLNAFLDMFEVFWNEFRKYHIVHEFKDLKTQPGLIASTKADLANISKNPISNWRQSVAFNMHMMLAEKAQSTTLIQKRGRGTMGNNTLTPVLHNYLTGIETVDDIIQMESRRLEGITIFVLIYSLYGLTFEAKRSVADKLLDEAIHSYTKKTKVAKTSFACGFLSLSDQRKNSCLTDYCFDVSKGSWVKWIDVKIKGQTDISPSFSQQKFSKVELERIGCQNHRLLKQPEQVPESVTTPENFVGLKERSLVVTPEYCMVNYFIEHFFSYGKHMTIVSEHQQGKSLIINTIFRRIIEQNKIITLNFDMQCTSNPQIIQHHIETHLLKDNGNVRRPPNKKTAIIWLDDVHMAVSPSNPESLLRSLQTQGGWFSYTEKNFYKILQTIFILTMSIRESEKMASRETMAAINVDIISKSPLLKLRKINQEEFKSIFLETVVSNIASTPTSSRKADDGLTSALFKQFISVTFANLEAIRQKTSYRSIGLSLENFYQVAKSFNCVNWRDINRNKKNVQFVMIWLLRELHQGDLGLLAIEYRTLINLHNMANENVLLRSAEEFASGNGKAGKIPMQDDPTLFTREYRQSTSGFDLLSVAKGSLKEDEGLQRDRSDSINMDDGSNAGNNHPSKPGFNKAESSKNVPEYGKESSSKKLSLKRQLEDQKGSVKPSLGNNRSNTSSKNKASLKQSPIKSRNKSSDLSDDQSPKSRSPAKKLTAPAKLSRFYQANIHSQQPQVVVAPATEKDSISKTLSKVEVSSPKISLGPKSSRQRELSNASSYSIAVSHKPMTVKEIQKEQLVPDIESSEYDESEEYVVQNKTLVSSLNKTNLNQDANYQGNLLGYHISDAPSEMGSDLPNTKKIIQLPRSSNGTEVHFLKSGRSSESGEPALAKMLNELIIHEDNPVVFMESYLNKIIMNNKFNTKESIDKIKSEVILKGKLFFDNAIQETEDKNEIEKDYDLFQSSFEVLDARKHQRLIKYLKQALENYIFQNPEALMALMLDKHNFSRFLNDFSSMHLSLVTDFQHLIVSSVKSNLYVKHLIGFVCDCLGEGYSYFDLSLDDSIDKPPTEVTQDTYRQIKDCIKENFDRIIKNNRRQVIVINVGSLSRKHTRSLLLKVVDLISAIAFNTDMVLDHFLEHMSDFINQIKKNRLWSHYENFFCSYIARNRLEAKVAFILLHENDTDEIYQRKLRLKIPDESNMFLRFLAHNFPKFASRAKKFVINGLRCGLPLETDAHFETILQFNPYEPSLIFDASICLEMAYLKQTDKDINYFCTLRPHYENLLLFNFLKNALKKYLARGGKLLSDSTIKEQNILINLIDRRREYSVKDIKAKTEEIEQKKLSIQEVSVNTTGMDTQYPATKEKKQNYFKMRIQLDKELDAIKYQEENFKKILKDLDEAQDTILNIKDKDLQGNLAQGLFLSSNTFKIYAVMYNELFPNPALPVLTDTDLGMLNLKTSGSAQYNIFAKSFSNLLSDIARFKAVVKGIKEKSLSVEVPIDRLQILYNIISNTDNSSISNFQSDQQLLMLWVDLLIESRVFMLGKKDNETKVAQISADLKKLQSLIDECDKVIEGFEHLIRESQNLKNKLEDDIEKLILGREEKEKTIISLDIFKKELVHVHSLYLRTTSPFIAFNLDKDVIIDAIVSFILFWNKYPYQVKRTLFFNLLKHLNVNIDIFGELQLYDFLSEEPALLPAMNSKVPFNLNMLNNIALMQFLQESTAPFCIVKDPSGLLVRYMEHKYARLLHMDYCIPSDSTLEDLEKCIEHGEQYLAIDPSEDLLRIIKPLIEWRYKRFCEHTLYLAEMSTNPTYSVTFRSKNIIVKEGFRLMIVLQKNRPKTFDPVVMAQCVFVNNDFSENKIWNETLTEELIIYLDNLKRNEYIQEFKKGNLQGKIYEQYNALKELLANFDFMHGSLESPNFQKIQKLLSEVAEIAKLQETRLLSKRENFLKAKEATEGLTPASDSEEIDQAAKSFLNNHYAISIPGYYKLYSKYIALADRLRVYQAANEKFKAYVGDQLVISQELFMYMFKECILGYKRELDELSNLEKAKENERIPSELNLSNENSDSTKKDQPIDVQEQIFSKIEKSFFKQIVNSIPNSCRYIYSFLCGLTYLMSYSGQKEQITRNVHLLLFSEKILARQKGNTSFVSRNLYEKFNQLLNSLGSHFIYSSTNIPANLELDSDFDRLLKSVNYLEEIRSNLKLEVVSESGSSLRHDRGTILAMGALVSGDTQMALHKVKSPTVQVDSSHKKSPIELKEGSVSIHGEKIEDKLTEVLIRQETMMDNYKELGKSKDSSRLEKNPDSYFREASEQIGSIYRRKPDRMTSMELYQDSYGNYENSLDEINKSRVQTYAGLTTFAKKVNMSKLRPFEMSLPIEQIVSEDNLPVRKDISTTERFGARILGEISPSRIKNPLQTLISATKAIIGKKKMAKVDFQTRFVEKMMSYVSKLMAAMTEIDRNAIINKSVNVWQDFMNLSRSALLMEQSRSIFPKTPLNQKVLDDMGPINLLSLFKYCRPDLLKFLLEAFYAEIRGHTDMRYNVDLGRFVKLESFRKPIALVYGHTYRSPFASLQRIADSMKIEIHVRQLEVNFRLDVMNKLLESSSKQGVWLVLENIELLSDVSAFSLMSSVAYYLNKQKITPKFKVWILYYHPCSSESDLVVHQKWPEWISFCYRIHFDLNRSIKEEMIGLYWANIYQMSTSSSEPSVAQRNQKKAILMKAPSILVSSNGDLAMMALEGKSRTLKDKTDNVINLASSLTALSAGTHFTRDYIKKYKPKLLYCLKFMWAICRQRSIHLSKVISREVVFSAVAKSDSQIDFILDGKVL